MRTRTRVTPKNETIVYNRTSIWPSGTNPTEVLAYAPYINDSGSTETIVDDDSASMAEKPVKHTRYSVQVHPPERMKLGYSLYQNPPSYFWVDWIFDTNAPAATFIKWSSQWRGLHPLTRSHLPELADVPTKVQQDAFEHMMPKVNDGLSIVNFILELKDLRRMFDFKTLERELQRGHRKFGILSDKITSNQGNKDRWQVLKDTANDFLNYSFGWKPFLGDLAKMYKALSSLDKRLDYLERNQGRVLRRHYSRDLEVVAMPCKVKTKLWEGRVGGLFISSSPYSDFGLNASAYRIDKFDYLPRYHATVDYSYTLPKYGLWKDTRRMIRGYLDAFGVRLDPSIIWNAIPFSFVVDWVVDVGGWLRQFTPNDLGMEVVVYDASHSVKYSQVSLTTASIPVTTRNTSAPLSHYVDIAVDDVTRAYYERAKWNPSTLFVGVSTPTLMQWTLGGALAISSDRKRFKRG